MIGLGLSQLTAPLFGGDVLVDAVFTPQFMTTASDAVEPLFIPDIQVLCGVEVFVQGLQLDPGAIEGWSLSTGLRLVVGS